MKKISKLSLPIAILMASFILGGFYYAGEINKQKSIERQQEIKFQKDILDNEQIEQKKQEINGLRQICIDKARETLRTDSVIDDKFCAECDGYANNLIIEKQCHKDCLDLSTKSLDKYKNTEETCFKRYPQN